MEIEKFYDKQVEYIIYNYVISIINSRLHPVYTQFTPGVHDYKDINEFKTLEKKMSGCIPKYVLQNLCACEFLFVIIIVKY